MYSRIAASRATRRSVPLEPGLYKRSANGETIGALGGAE
jgi:hypothetical protein